MRLPAICLRVQNINPFLDSFNRDAEYHMRVRYTAITRAVGKLWYVLPYSKNCPHWTDLSFGGFKP